jgi:hypothetical protein
MATLYRGYIYDVGRLRDESFKGAVWPPPETQRNAGRPIAALYAATSAEAERMAKHWIDHQLDKNGT